MRNVIFGSGIVGLFAKHLLPSWDVVPFHRSRFFAYSPALDDNFIIRDDEIDQFITDLCGPCKTVTYRRAFSVGGQLVPKYDKTLGEAWLGKIFGQDAPSHAGLYLSTRLELEIYDVKVNKLYVSLLNKYKPLLTDEFAKGEVTEVGEHYFVRNGVREDFDNAISTIPLDAMVQLAKVQLQLRTRPLHYIRFETGSLDFEGANQVLVVDGMFSFFKVTNIAPRNYLMYCQEDIPQPGTYLMAFIGTDLEIVDGTSIPGALPLGELAKTEWLEKLGIYPIGSYAQWDWCADVGSNLLRLLRYAQRGFKPRGMQTLVLK